MIKSVEGMFPRTFVWKRYPGSIKIYEPET